MYTGDYKASELPKFFQELLKTSYISSKAFLQGIKPSPTSLWSTAETKRRTLATSEIKTNTLIFSCAKSLNIKPLQELASSRLLALIPTVCSYLYFNNTLELIYKVITHDVDDGLRRSITKLVLSNCTDRDLAVGVVKKHEPRIWEVAASPLFEAKEIRATVKHIARGGYCWSERQKKVAEDLGFRFAEGVSKVECFCGRRPA